MDELAIPLTFLRWDEAEWILGMWVNLKSGTMLNKNHQGAAIDDRAAASPIALTHRVVKASGTDGRGMKALLCLVMITLFLPGCALDRPPDHDTVIRQALPEDTDIPAAWSSPADTVTVADDWLASFNDPALDALVAEAIRNNPDLRQAAAMVAMARQTVTVVGSQLYPQVNVPIGISGMFSDKYASGNQSDNYEFYGSNHEYAVVSWEIDVWGRLRAQREASAADYQATAMDYAYARQSLAATVAKSWYLAVEARQLFELAHERVRIYAELLDLVQFRRAAGKVADLDVAEAEANLNTAASMLQAAQGQYSEAQRNLERLLGRYPAAELAASQAFVPVPPPVQTGIPASLLKRRPDLLAAEQQVLAAFRLQEAARLALLPTFGLSLDGGHLSDRLTSLLQINPWLLHGTIGMNVPIYTGGVLQAQVEITTVQQEQMIARYGSVALKAFYEVEVALTNDTLLMQRLAEEEKGLKANSEAVRIARTRYMAGASDMLTVLQLEERYLTSQSTVIQLRNAQLANRINLHLALGGGFDAVPAANL
jgi:multidrug efflux system outer membrane protein